MTGPGGCSFIFQMTDIEPVYLPMLITLEKNKFMALEREGVIARVKNFERARDDVYKTQVLCMAFDG